MYKKLAEITFPIQIIMERQCHVDTVVPMFELVRLRKIRQPDTRIIVTDYLFLSIPFFFFFHSMVIDDRVELSIFIRV
jgi:hypothetical protein